MMRIVPRDMACSLGKRPADEIPAAPPAKQSISATLLPAREPARGRPCAGFGARCQRARGPAALRGPVRHRPRTRFLFRLELQRRRIDAIAQSGWPGAVLEHMAEMAAAA